MATAPLLTPVLASLATLAIAVALDLALAEPPARVHPVALFGSVVGRFDRSWSRPRLVGVAVAVGLPIGVAAFAGGIVAAASFALPAFSALPVLVAGTILFTTVSLRMLLATTAEVVELTETDPDAARESVRALAGRTRPTSPRPTSGARPSRARPRTSPTGSSRPSAGSRSERRSDSRSAVPKSRSRLPRGLPPRSG